MTKRIWCIIAVIVVIAMLDADVNKKFSPFIDYIEFITNVLLVMEIAPYIYSFIDI